MDNALVITDPDTNANTRVSLGELQRSIQSERALYKPINIHPIIELVISGQATKHPIRARVI